MPKTPYKNVLEKFKERFKGIVAESDGLIPELEMAASIKDLITRDQVIARIAVLVDRRSEARECLKIISAVLPGESKVIKE